ncbi:MAG: DUF697 domain-containing protein [Calditrichia bacterium]|nr:DUF697 domain-containing protein [Calditrichia bacterium]
MRKTVKAIFLSLSILILLLFFVFVINQTVQIVTLASSLHPYLGTVTIWGLLILYVLLISIPLYLYFRLPKTLVPPDDINSAEFTLYLDRLGKRMSSNAHLQGRSFKSRREIEEALKELNLKSMEIIKKQATIVFIATAISQSGRLDAFTVLLAQIRMVWQIARIYNQRPTLREMTQLYANVAATAFIASELNDMDISQQIEPIVSSVLGASLTGTIPGVNIVATIVTNSLISGSTNAFLTLRVGIIARKYCGNILKKERGLIRKSASLEAARYLSMIVMSSAGNISRSIVNAAVKSPGRISRDVLRTTWEKLLGKEKPASEISEDG